MIRQRHAAHYLQLAEKAAPGLQGTEQAHWMTRREIAYTNLRSVLAGAVPQAEHLPSAALLATALTLF